jgi:CubicO group peptidase (beta-lactamase class C family)
MKGIAFRRRRLTLAAVAFTAAWGAAPGLSAGQGPAPAAKDLESFFRSQVSALGLAAVGACIVEGDRIAWSGGFGLADRESGRPAESRTIFGVGSLSKTVTLAAFMRLWEEGKCSLDDDINRYLSFPVRNPRFPDRPITIRMLLSFTAGIFDVDFTAGRNRLDFLHAARDPAVSAETALEPFLTPGGRYYSAENFLETAPGERYAYSNSSYSLIVCVIERLAGRPFWQYCRDALFIPLRMSDSSWRLSDLDRSRFAYGYAREADRLVREEPTTWPGYMDGGLRTTTRDFGNFLIMLMNRGRFEGRRILRPETVDAMLALQNPPGAPPGRGFPTLGRAFVWILSQVGGRRLFQMNGFGPAFFAQAYFDPAGKIGGAFFTTGGFDSPQALGTAVGMFFERLLAATGRREEPAPRPAR